MSNASKRTFLDFKGAGNRILFTVVDAHKAGTISTGETHRDLLILRKVNSLDSHVGSGIDVERTILANIDREKIRIRRLALDETLHGELVVVRGKDTGRLTLNFNGVVFADGFRKGEERASP